MCDHSRATRQIVSERTHVAGARPYCASTVYGSRTGPAFQLPSADALRVTGAGNCVSTKSGSASAEYIRVARGPALLIRAHCRI